jgi:ankyrin repeat protein
VYRPGNLLEAVLLGDRPAVDRFLAAGADVDATEADGTTPLMRAVHGGFPEITFKLIAVGADVSRANRYGVTALYLAARGGDAAATRALLAAGADADTALPEGETALMTAAKAGNAAVVRTLLTGGTEFLSLSALADDSPVTVTQPSSGYGSLTNPPLPTNRANVNAREGWYGQTALMWAAAEGYADVVRLLLESGARIDARSREIDKPESYAEWQQGSAYPTVPRGRLTALHFAAREGQFDALQALVDGGANLDAVDAEGKTAVVYATLNDHLDVAALLLESGAAANAADAYGRAPLLAAVHLNTLNANARPAGRAANAPSPVDIVKLALANGADPNAALRRDVPGDPAQGIAHPLLDAGTTPFLRAAMSSDLETMNLLLAAGADPLATTSAGTTSLMAAAGVGGREPISRGRGVDAIQALELLLAQGVDINATNQTGNTALHGAALRGSTAIIQFLVDHGANALVKNAKGQTPLDIAVGVPDDRIPYNESAASLLRRLTPRA